MADDVERRACPDGLRAEPGERPVLAGLAIPTDALSHDLGGFKEIITAGALTRALERKPDLLAVVNHDKGRVLGRLSAGTLAVSQDPAGLSFRVTPPSHERGLVESVERGDTPGASFEFRTVADTWDMATTPPTRTVTDMQLGERAPGVALPAYPNTLVARRSLDDHLRKGHRIAMEQPQPTPPTPPPDPTPPTPPALDPHLEREQRTFSLRALVAGAAGLPGVDWGRE